MTAIFIAGFAALGLLTAGCGGDDSADAGQIDKATFIKRANVICEQASGRLAAEIASAVSTESPTGPNRTKIQVTLVKKVLVPGLEAELDEIRALGLPSEGKAQARAFIQAAQKVIINAKVNPKRFNESVNPYEAAELAGTRFGLSACPVAPVNAG